MSSSRKSLEKFAKCNQDLKDEIIVEASPNMMDAAKALRDIEPNKPPANKQEKQLTPQQLANWQQIKKYRVYNDYNWDSEELKKMHKSPGTYDCGILGTWVVWGREISVPSGDMNLWQAMPGKQKYEYWKQRVK